MAVSAPARIAQADPSLERDAAAFHGALSEFMRVVRFRDRDCICCYDLSVTQSDALAELVRRGPLTLNELAARLYLEKSTTSRVIAALERKGYVRRAPHPADGRSLQLGVTPSGRRIHLRIERDILAAEQQLLAELEPEVRAAVTRLVSQLAAAAACGVDASGGSCCRVD